MSFRFDFRRRCRLSVFDISAFSDYFQLSFAFFRLSPDIFFEAIFFFFDADTASAFDFHTFRQMFSDYFLSPPFFARLFSFF
jgi:hypothetical protein